MLEPETPLPWRPMASVSPKWSLFGIDSDSLGPEDYICGICDCGYGGFDNRADMEYAVYAANLLPKLIHALTIIRDQPMAMVVDEQGIAKSALNLVETYRP